MFIIYLFVGLLHLYPTFFTKELKLTYNPFYPSKFIPATTLQGRLGWKWLAQWVQMVFYF